MGPGPHWRPYLVNQVFLQRLGAGIFAVASLACVESAQSKIITPRRRRVGRPAPRLNST